MKKIKLLLLATIGIVSAYAQKLPRVQTTGLRAPANVKIDGKLTEWDNKFQAYNIGNYIYYTLSNDNDNLYLTVRMDGVIGNKKIFKGGLTLTLMNPLKKTEKLAVTFPAIADRFLEETQAKSLAFYKTLIADTAKDKTKFNAEIKYLNDGLRKNYKQIRVAGIPGISEELLSIYNDQGILTGANYDEKMRYNYELAIPLKYVMAALGNEKSLRYNIKLSTDPPLNMVQTGPSTKPKVDAVRFPGGMQANADMDFLLHDTDFSGEYTLAN